MGLRQAVAGLGNAEVAILGVGPQAIGHKILVAVMADGDALLRTRALGGGLPARLGLAVLGLDGFSRGGFRAGLVGNALARRRFFVVGGAGRGPRCRLLLGPRSSPVAGVGHTLAAI